MGPLQIGHCSPFRAPGVPVRSLTCEHSTDDIALIPRLSWLSCHLTCAKPGTFDMAKCKTVPVKSASGNGTARWCDHLFCFPTPFGTVTESLKAPCMAWMDDGWMFHIPASKLFDPDRFLKCLVNPETTCWPFWTWATEPGGNDTKSNTKQLVAPSPSWSNVSVIYLYI